MSKKATKSKETPKQRKGTFLYYAGTKPAPEKMPDGDAKVLKLLSKNGLSFKELVVRAKLPPSTVDWARIRLMKAGAMSRTPAKGVK